MSFRINTNVQAMNALRNLGETSSSAASSMTRLSTGLRINSGADDPAGLQISEGFRAQITGIDQALRNNQDASNYAKTAEGALGEVNKLLRDARSLALANSNDATLTSAQKQANQNQLNSILSSIDRIASNTSYGSKKLLDGSAGVSSYVTDSSKIASLSIGGTIGTQSITANGSVTVNVTTAAVQATSTLVQGQAFAATTVAAALAAQVGTTNAGSFTVNGVTFTATSNMTNSDVINMVNARSGDTGVTLSLVDNAGAATFQFKAVDYGTVGNDIVVTSQGTTVAAAVGSFNLSTGVDAVATVTVGALNAVNFAVQSGDDGLTLKDSAGNIVKLASAGNAVASSAVGQVVAGSAQFQIGANGGQTANLSLSNMNSTSLGLSSVDIMSTSAAATALTNIDAAIDSVTKVRGDLGSFMRNVIESNVRSLGVARENLSAADSTIRDVDVAEEMTKFTQLQILQQSGMAMLAQANSAPQSVLSLLRG